MKNRCKVEKITYKVDEEKGVVVCIIECDIQTGLLDIPFYIISEANNAKFNPNIGKFTVTGISRCHPEDTFNVVKGKRIAESKAKAKMYKKAATLWSNTEKYIKKRMIKQIRDRALNCTAAYMGELNHIIELSK